MFPVLSRVRSGMTKIGLLVASLVLAACQSGTGPTAGGPARNDGSPIPVALLVPGGSSDSGDNFIAQSLENAARLAIADLGGVQIDLRVYHTQGLPEQAGPWHQRPWMRGPRSFWGRFSP